MEQIEQAKQPIQRQLRYYRILSWLLMCKLTNDSNQFPAWNPFSESQI